MQSKIRLRFSFLVALPKLLLPPLLSGSDRLVKLSPRHQLLLLLLPLPTLLPSQLLQLQPPPPLQHPPPPQLQLQLQHPPPPLLSLRLPLL